MTIEVRSFTSAENIDATDEGVIFGLAIPYNRATNIGDPKTGGFEERIAPGSATKSLREADIVALYNHDSSRPLGRTSAGNLKLANTTRGVEPELKPSDVSYARDLATLVKDKIIRGWSFGFEVIKDDWTDDDGNPANEWTGTKRTIREMKLIEVSPVTFPAYDSTEIASRSAILEARQERAKASTDEGGQEREERGGNAPGDGSKPYGNVAYADPGYRGGKKRYPIDTKNHAKAAWSYINKAKNAAMYSAKQLASIKAKIKAACKKFGVQINEENALELAKEWRCYLKDYDPDLVIDDTEERDDDPELFENRKLKGPVAKRVAQIHAEIDQALNMFDQCDVNSLPHELQQAAALIGSARTHIQHIVNHEDVSFSDAVGMDDREQNASADTEQRETQPKPDGESTSAETLSDDALRLEFMKAVSREVELGL